MANSSYIDVDAAIKASEAALKEKHDAMEKVAIVRTDLRNAVTMGVATTEQKKWIEGTFPIRERTRGKREDPAPVVPIDKGAAA